MREEAKIIRFHWRFLDSIGWKIQKVLLSGLLRFGTIRESVLNEFNCKRSLQSLMRDSLESKKIAIEHNPRNFFIDHYKSY